MPNTTNPAIATNALKAAITFHIANSKGSVAATKAILDITNLPLAICTLALPSSSLLNKITDKASTIFWVFVLAVNSCTPLINCT